MTGFEDHPSPDGLERKPCDPELQARVKAKARGEKYDPAKHGPFDYRLPPRQARRDEPEHEDPEFEALLERFRSRPQYGPRLVRDRPDVRRVANQ